MALIAVIKSKGEEHRLNITSTPSIIGRSSRCTLTLNDDLISAKHLAIVVKAGKVLIKDMDSTNGTYLNGQQVSNCHLKINDDVTFGSSSLSLDASAMNSIEKKSHFSPKTKKNSGISLLSSHNSQNNHEEISDAAKRIKEKSVVINFDQEGVEKSPNKPKLQPSAKLAEDQSQEVSRSYDSLSQQDDATSVENLTKKEEAPIEHEDAPDQKNPSNEEERLKKMLTSSRALNVEDKSKESSNTSSIGDKNFRQIDQEQSTGNTQFIQVETKKKSKKKATSKSKAKAKKKEAESNSIFSKILRKIKG